MPRFDELLVMPDEEFFSLLDLEQSPLQAVRCAVSGDDFETARTALVDYYRNLDHTPFGLLPPVDETHPPQTTPDGERALEHRVSIWGREVQLPPDIPWLRPDASHPYRGDYHVVSQLNDHGLIRRLVDAYCQTGNPRYARHAVDLMFHWLRTCTPFPRPRHAPTDRTEVWYNPAHSNRVANWCHAFFALRHFTGISTDEHIAILKTIFREQEYKRDHYQGNPNHIISQLLGFVKFGVWWPAFRAAREWAVDALRDLRTALDDFFYPDGAYVELCYMHGDLVEACRLARKHGFPIAPDFAEKVSRTFDFPMYAAHPRGGYPPWNDSGGNLNERDPLPDKMGWLVELGADFTGRDDLRYVDTWGREGTPPAHTSHHFPHAGFFVMRSDWTPGARFLMFDGGRNLGGYQHPHMDQLSFVLAAYGHTLITDTGYGGPWFGRWRQEYYVATPGHNAIAVDDQWQVQYPEENPAANQRWHARPMIGNLWSVSPGLVTHGITSGPLPGNRWTSDPQFDYARSIYDQGFTRDPHSLPEKRLQVIHERRILFLKPDYWIMTDFLTGAGEHEYEACFHFPTAAQAETTATGISIRHLGARLHILPLCAQPFAIRIVSRQREPIQGWLPGDWGEHIPAPTAIVSGRVRLPLTLHTVLFPSPADRVPRISAGFPDADDSAIEVIVDNRRDLYFASQNPEGEHRIGEWIFSGESAALRLDGRGRIHSRFGAIDTIRSI